VYPYIKVEEKKMQ